MSFKSVVLLLAAFVVVANVLLWLTGAGALWSTSFILAGTTFLAGLCVDSSAVKAWIVSKLHG